MANTAPVITTWVGTTTDGSLGSNWSDGLPDATTIDAVMDSTSTKSIVTGFGAIRARGTLAASTNFVENDTVTLDSKTYTYKDAPSADGEVDVGTDIETSLDNLHDAINLVSGGAYGASMTIHPTVTAISNTASSLVVAAKNGGTAGNSIVSTASTTPDPDWLAATLGSGAADSATIGNIYTLGWAGSIHTSATKAPINCGLFMIEGRGQINLDIVNCTRIAVNSPNYAKAADLVMTSSLAELEIISGRCVIDCPTGTAVPIRITVADTRGSAENLRLTGAASLTGAQLMVGPGIASVDGPDWTKVVNMAGIITIEDGAVALLHSTGRVALKTSDVMTEAWIMGGDLDTTTNGGVKTVTDVHVAPAGVFTARRNTDSFTEHLIGRK